MERIEKCDACGEAFGQSVPEWGAVMGAGAGRVSAVMGAGKGDTPRRAVHARAAAPGDGAHDGAIMLQSCSGRGGRQTLKAKVDKGRLLAPKSR
jgi:hypothetical protein